MKHPCRWARPPLLAVVFLLVMTACAGRVPDDIGVHDGRLALCPDTPNCVSSMERGRKHHVEPIALPLPAGEGAFAPMECLVRALLQEERVELLEQGEGYVHAACSSKVFGFVDDLEFLLDRESNVVHVRSAARMGYTDFGVNRARVERLRQRFHEQCTRKES